MNILNKLKENWNNPQKPSRWNDNYVLKNDWIICLLPFANIIPILFIIGILESISVLCPMCNNIPMPNWSFYILIVGTGVFLYVFTTKILFTYLKGSGMLIYQPKQQKEKSVSHE